MRDRRVYTLHRLNRHGPALFAPPPATQLDRLDRLAAGACAAGMVVVAADIAFALWIVAA